MQRTYSRKRAQRRTYTSGGTQDEPLSLDLGRARKRHKIEVEVVSPQNSSDNNAHETGIEGDLRYGSENRNRSTPSTHKPPARLRTPTTPVQESPPPVSSRKTLARSATTSLVADEDQTTPRRRARDLSDIFSFASSTTIPGPSHGVAKPHGGVARRMLSRARTESSVISISSFSEQEYNSIHGTPKKLRAFASDSIVGTPSSHSHSPSYPPSEAKPSDDVSSPPVRPVLGNPNNIRTYAGKSRSFLVALPPSQAASLGMDPVLSGDPSAMFGENHEDDFEIRESYSELRQRWGVDASEDDPRPVSPRLSPSPKRKGKGKGLPKEDPVRLLPNGMMNDLKSITELRSKGESRRFLDEVGYLFEGLDAQGALSVRRGSALEIVSKLCDVDFARRAKAADFLGRAWEVLREAGAGDGDRVLDSVLTFYAALVARDPTDLSDLSTKHDFAATLHRMLASLEHHNDPLWLISCRAEVELRAAGISKAETATLDNLHRLVRKKSGIFGECDIISNRLLISSALTVVTPSTHTLSHLSPLLRSLTSEINFLPSRVSAYASGLSLFPPHGSSSHVNTPSLLYLENCLRLLDSCLLGSWSISEEGLVIQAESLEKLREDGFPTALLALCVSCCIIFQDSALEEHRAIASRCVESALRVLINLTHDDLTWCRAVLDDEHSIPTIMRLIVMTQCERRILEKRADVDEADSEPDDNAARCLDRLCLALGLLTNLVQATPDARQIVGETLLDFNCPGQRRCLRECTCPSRTSSLVCLAQVYTDYYKSSNELDAVVRGHMAVLFGLLMQHAAANQRALLAALPGVDDRAKLGVLLQHAQDFTLFYVALTRKMAEVQDRDHDDDDDEVEDSGHAASAVFRDSKGEAVAKGVIDFLKTLRTEGGR